MQISEKLRTNQQVRLSVSLPFSYQSTMCKVQQPASQQTSTNWWISLTSNSSVITIIFIQKAPYYDFKKSFLNHMSPRCGTDLCVFIRQHIVTGSRRTVNNWGIVRLNYKMFHDWIMHLHIHDALC